MIRTWLSGLLDLLAPHTCAGCELDLPIATPHQGEFAGFCPACAPLIEPAPLEFRPPARDAAVLRYQGPIADAIRRFKYAGASQLAGVLSMPLVAVAAGYVGSFDAVVPMPLFPARLRERGYNPSALLARPVARALGVPMPVSWLVRRRATQSQAGLSREARLQNVQGAFAARAAAPARLLLIDDVRTTGATLAEAARTLQESGHDVATLALAWAPAPNSAATDAV